MLFRLQEMPILMVSIASNDTLVKWYLFSYCCGFVVNFLLAGLRTIGIITKVWFFLHLYFSTCNECTGNIMKHQIYSDEFLALCFSSNCS